MSVWITCPLCGWDNFFVEAEPGDFMCIGCSRIISHDLLCDDANDRARDDEATS